MCWNPWDESFWLIVPNTAEETWPLHLARSKMLVIVLVLFHCITIYSKSQWVYTTHIYCMSTQFLRISHLRAVHLGGSGSASLMGLPPRYWLGPYLLNVLWGWPDVMLTHMPLAHFVPHYLLAWIFGCFPYRLPEHWLDSWLLWEWVIGEREPTCPMWTLRALWPHLRMLYHDFHDVLPVTQTNFGTTQKGIGRQKSRMWRSWGTVLEAGYHRDFSRPQCSTGD